MSEEEEATLRLGRIIMRGAKLSRAVTSRVTSAELSWATDQVTQLSMTVVDPDLSLWRSAVFERGTPLVYREPGMKDIALRVRALDLDGGPTGTGAFTVMARSEGVQKLKRRRGPKVMRKASPSDFVRAECKAVGLKAVVQKSAERAQVKRDLPVKGQEDTRGAERPSSWTTFGRLASELGFLVFEFADTVYFGKPTWLLDRDEETPLKVTLPLEGTEKAKLMARSIPQIRMSEDADAAVEINGLEIERARLKECAPGGAVELLGLPPFDDPYLITRLSMPLLGTDAPLTIDASTPVNPEPQPPQPPGGGLSGSSTLNLALPGAPTGAVQQSGTRSAYDFVTMAISASNAAYVFGGEASASDPTPAALDCSELIEWALRRVGVVFPDGSANQNAAMRQIGVAAAMRTRGALLYMPGHIGISLGDGRSMEARNPSAGVGIFRAADISWTNGGLVPGLRYG